MELSRKYFLGTVPRKYAPSVYHCSFNPTELKVQNSQLTSQRFGVESCWYPQLSKRGATKGTTSNVGTVLARTARLRGKPQGGSQELTPL